MAPPAASQGSATPVVSEVQAEGRNGSEYRVDLLMSLGFEYVCASPELITCMHEESAVAMAQGYFKAEGKPRVQMPPYSVEILSEADLDDIYAYVSSRAAPAASEGLSD